MSEYSRRRLVLDTNVLVSALLFRLSVPGRALERITLQGQLLFSGETWNELSEFLRPKFDRYAPRGRRQQALDSLEVELVTITQRVRACRDTKDDMILEVALNGKADLIISGDKDLLSLGSFGGISILSPA